MEFSVLFYVSISIFIVSLILFLLSCRNVTKLKKRIIKLEKEKLEIVEQAQAVYNENIKLQHDIFKATYYVPDLD